MTTPEGKIKNKVKAYLTSIGAYYFMPVQMGYGKKGLDFFVCHRGYFIAIETKRPGGKLEGFQTRIASEILGAYGLVFRVHDDASLEHFKSCVSKYSPA